MKVLVPIKRVPDWQIKIKIKPDNSGIETNGMKWIVNTFDEIAVEEAIRMKEKNIVTEIHVVSIGPADARARLEYALAMGADSAMLVPCEGEVDSDLASRVIAEIFKKGDYKLILMGKQAIDSDSGQTPQLISARLNIPCASFASKIEPQGDAIQVTREIDGGLEHVKFPLPAVVSTDLRLNEPRYPALPNIMKAKKKPFSEVTLESLGLAHKSALKILKLAAPPQRKAGKKVGSVDELIAALQNEAKVL